jgi:methionyl-tRNA formyltransferase
MISRGQSPSVQQGEVSLAPKITKQDAFLNFSNEAKTIVDAIRAFTYEPGAWCNWKNESFKITSAFVVGDKDIPPAEIVFDGQRVFVGCAMSSCLELLTVVPAGKKEMNAADWARGARLQGGDNFG